MIKKLANLGLNPSDSMKARINIAMNDLSYYIEVSSQNRKPAPLELGDKTECINIREVRKLEEYLERKEQDKKIKTLEKLEKIEGNHFGRKAREVRREEVKLEEVGKALSHPCLSCRAE
jgi:hypothetical protein